MRTISIFKNGNNQAVRLPKDMEFAGVSELEIMREGNQIILQPTKPTWASLASVGKADSDFLQNREKVAGDEGRMEW